VGDADLAARFLKRHAWSSPAHTNVVVVYDYFKADGAAYIAMEFVERGPLTLLMRRVTVPQSLGVLVLPDTRMGANEHASAGCVR